LCNISQSDNKLITGIADNVTALLSQKNPDEVGQFCPDLQKSQKHYFSKSSEIIHIRSCTDNCIMPNDEIKPLCKFVLWSWKFLSDQPKGEQSFNSYIVTLSTGNLLLNA